jgi:serine/threonine protein kinase
MSSMLGKAKSLDSLAGSEVNINNKTFQVIKRIGEGGFAFVYMVREGTAESSMSDMQSYNQSARSAQVGTFVLKASSVQTSSSGDSLQRTCAEKEVSILKKLTQGKHEHPAIIKLIDHVTRPSGRGRADFLLLLEYAERGHVMDAVKGLKTSNTHFELGALVKGFASIVNAVNHMHSLNMTHRDLKLENFLIKSDGQFKLCDFGSCVFGEITLEGPIARSNVEEIIGSTTTQMYRAPEMVDLYLQPKLDKSTDIWALGCCLYMMAFLQNCFEEGSNLAILSGKHQGFPSPKPYGPEIETVIERCLVTVPAGRLTALELLDCLQATFQKRPLPERSTRVLEAERVVEQDLKVEAQNQGKYRTDGQGVGMRSAGYVPKVKASSHQLSGAAARRMKNRGGGVSPVNHAVPQQQQQQQQRPKEVAPVAAEDSLFGDSSDFGATAEAQNYLQSPATNDPFGSSSGFGSEAPEFNAGVQQQQQQQQQTKADLFDSGVFGGGGGKSGGGDSFGGGGGGGGAQTAYDDNDPFGSSGNNSKQDNNFGGSTPFDDNDSSSTPFDEPVKQQVNQSNANNDDFFGGGQQQQQQKPQEFSMPTVASDPFASSSASAAAAPDPFASSNSASNSFGSPTPTFQGQGQGNNNNNGMGGGMMGGSSNNGGNNGMMNNGNNNNNSSNSYNNNAGNNNYNKNNNNNNGGFSMGSQQQQQQWQNQNQQQPSMRMGEQQGTPARRIAEHFTGIGATPEMKHVQQPQHVTAYDQQQKQAGQDNLFSGFSAF